MKYDNWKKNPLKISKEAVFHLMRFDSEKTTHRVFIELGDWKATLPYNPNIEAQPFAVMNDLFKAVLFAAHRDELTEHQLRRIQA